MPSMNQEVMRRPSAPHWRFRSAANRPDGRRTSRKCRLDPALADDPIVGRWVEPDHLTVFHNSTQIIEITNVVQRIAANEDQIRTIALADLADLVAQPDRLRPNDCGTSQCELRRHAGLDHEFDFYRHGALRVSRRAGVSPRNDRNACRDRLAKTLQTWVGRTTHFIDRVILQLALVAPKQDTALGS